MLSRQGKKTLASEANHLVWIQTSVRVADGEGGQTKAWTDTLQTWASVSPIQARQRFEYESVNVHATHLLRIRGAVTVTEKNRVRFGSRYFEILTVENIRERSIVQVLTCKEIRQ